MKLERRDIEAVAKSRIARAEGNKSTVWTVGAMVAIVAGLFVMNYSTIGGWVMLLGGFIAFIYYMQALSKRQNTYKSKLVKEWMQEQKPQEQK